MQDWEFHKAVKAGVKKDTTTDEKDANLQHEELGPTGDSNAVETGDPVKLQTEGLESVGTTRPRNIACSANINFP